ncbi:ferredoxin [Gordonia sp. GONU]|uniref:ferredoxin n=1 Tax=Gordonia sp. GONU TaxID=2972949 RepID=UPI0021ACC3A1|nr:ferredoxin [Gordonia sp. GONU]MCR8899758.1 ferredoxin [Gordonia sp. GONU]
MKVTVNDNCQGCGICEATAPDVFAVSDDGVAQVLLEEIPAELEAAVKEAMEECPTEAIEIA